MTRKGLTTILDTTRRPLIIIVEAPVNNPNMETAVRAKGQQKFEAEPATKKVKFDPLAKVYSVYFKSYKGGCFPCLHLKMTTQSSVLSATLQYPHYHREDPFLLPCWQMTRHKWKLLVEYNK